MPKESVWDYPRPPAVVPCERRVRVVHGGETIAESKRALRVLETSSPPTIYIPREDVREDLLIEAGDDATTECEWKGTASYVHAEAGGLRSRLTFSASSARPAFLSLEASALRAAVNSPSGSWNGSNSGSPSRTSKTR